MRAAFGFILGLTLAAVPPPAVAETPEYPAKGMNVFDPQANGMADVDAALKQAANDRKRVIVMFGANWCGWCHRLNDAFESDPVLIGHFNRDFVLVKVDVNAKSGQQRNRDVVERFDKPTRVGLPALLVLEPTGAMVALQKASEWKMPDGKAYQRSKVLASFESWVPAKP